jgi:hypothetical protein
MTLGTLLVVLAGGTAMALEPEGGTPPEVIDRANDGENRCEGTGQPDIIFRSPGRDIIAKEGGDIAIASQDGRGDVFGNKGDDSLDVQDGEGNDFVNYDESAKTDPSATAATSSPTATATSPGAVWLRACLPSGQILGRLDGSWCRASGSETPIP